MNSSEELKINPLLSFYKNNLKELLADDERFIIHLCQESVFNLDDRKRVKLDFEAIFNSYILTLPTYKLLAILHKLSLDKHVNLARKIENTWESLIIETKRLAVENYSTVLKFSKFQSDKVNFINFQNILTPIQIVARKKPESYKDDVYFEEGFEFLENIDNSQGRFLIKGEAGVGKSYHFIKLIHLWAIQERILQDYLVLKVDLSQLSSNDSFEENLYNQNFSKDSWVTRDLLHYFLSDDCEYRNIKIIFLFDGADEYGSKESLFSNIIENDGCIKFPIIVWCRNWKAEQIEDTYHNVLEILGYKDDHIPLFFAKFFHEGTDIFQNLIESDNTPKSQQLINFLQKNREDLLKSCSNPLIASITANIWDTKWNSMKKDSYSIYDDAVELLMKNRTNTIDKEDYDAFLHQCALEAFINILFDKPIEMKKYSEDSKVFGNLLTTLTCFQTGKKHYRFIHFSFQEYFAAKFIIKCLETNANCLISDVTEQQCQGKLLEIICQSTYTLKLKATFDFIKSQNMQIFSMIIKENPIILSILDTVNEKIIDLIKYKSDSQKIYLEDGYLSTTVWFSIVETFSRNITVLSFKNVKINFQKFINISIESLKGTLIELSIDSGVYNHFSVRMIEDIVKEFSNLKLLLLANIPFNNSKKANFFINSNSLESLSLINCEIDFNLLNLLKCRHLNHLNLSHNTIAAGQLEKLVDYLENSLELHSINFSYCALKDEHFTILKRLFEEMTDIYNFWLDGNEFSDSFVDDLMKFLIENGNNVKEFSVKDCNSNITASTVTSLLDNNLSLNILNLYGNKLLNVREVSFPKSIILSKELQELRFPIMDCDTAIEYKDFYEIMDGNLELKMLDYSGNNLKVQFLFGVLQKIISFSTNLESINLSNCKLPLEHQEELFNSLKVHDKLLNMNLEGNLLNEKIFLNFINHRSKKLNKEGVKLNVSQCDLRQFSLIELINLNMLSINLSGNNLKETINWKKMTIKNPTCIKELLLQKCQLNSSFVNVLTVNLHNLPSLEVLDISINKFSDQAILNFFNKASTQKNSLKYVYFYGGKLTIKALIDLSISISKINDIEVINSPFIDEESDDFNQLNSINLANSKYFNLQIINEILFQIDSIMKYKKLQINSTESPRYDMIRMVKESSLEIRSISIYDDLIPDEINHMKSIIENNTDIETMELNFNLSHETIMTFFGMTKEFIRRIKSFSYNSNSNSKSSIMDIINFHEFLHNQQDLKRLSLTCLNFVTSNAIKFFKDYPNNSQNLNTLKLFRSKFTEETSEYLGKFISNQLGLKSLDLGSINLDGNIGEKLFKNISNSCCNLNKINLSNCHLNDTALEYLGQVFSYQTHLDSIDLSGIDLSNKYGCQLFQNLANSNKFTKVKLQNCSLNGKILPDLQRFIQNQTNLNVVDLSNVKYNVDIQQDILQDFSFKCKNISELYLRNCRFSDSLSRVIGKLLTEQNSINVLDLSFSNLSKTGAENLFNQISHNTSLSEVDLSNSTFTEDMIEYIGKFLYNQISLKVMNISMIKLKNMVGMLFFQHLTNPNMKLKELYLTGCKFTANMTEYIGKFIDSQNHLQILDLSNTNLRSNIGKNLFINISNKCCNLRNLNMENCQLTEDMTEELGKFIGYQNQLNILDLADVNLEHNIGKNLFENISKVCCNIHEICLDDCKLTEDMSDSLGKFIGYQNKLELLYMANADLKNDIGKNFFRNISSQCCNIREIIMEKSIFTEDVTKYLGEFISYQKKLKLLDIADTKLDNAIGMNLFKNVSDLCCPKAVNLLGCKLSDQVTECLDNTFGLETDIAMDSSADECVNEEIDMLA
ncbi:DgyrCDS3211 [Dimorphilus gyrociliatus]|uniref:DgyrCDS3211 n=1 Tax=Dimorphilus gyrociliatus TaxID=2664684 RepID=A0A7I8VCX9_9ANNE|nr:DgyrCDS3211 [Dimorphilus gyrociliatus]